MKTLLIVTFLTWHGSGSSSTQTVTPMLDMYSCMATADNIRKSAANDDNLGHTKVAVICANDKEGAP